MDTENYSSKIFTFIVRRGYPVLAFLRVILFIIGSTTSNGDLVLTIITVVLLFLMSTTISKVSLEGNRLICKSDLSNRSISVVDIIEIIDIPLFIIPPLAIVRYNDSMKIRMVWFFATYNQSFRKHTQLERLRRLSGLL
jgi:uncharacterized membrane protein